MVAAIQQVAIPHVTTWNKSQGRTENLGRENTLIRESQTGAEVFFNKMVDIGSKNMSVGFWLENADLGVG